MVSVKEELTGNDAEFLRDVEAGQARFLERRPAPVPTPQVRPEWVRPLGMRLDDRLGTGPLCDMILGKWRHGVRSQLHGIAITVWQLVQPKGRELIALRRRLRKRRS